VWYLAQSDSAELLMLLLEQGAPVDVPALDHTTALYHAAKRGNLEMALMLLQHGADLNRYRKHFLGPDQEFRQKLLAASPAPKKDNLKKK
jgi:ankyrin repeat protein